MLEPTIIFIILGAALVYNTSPLPNTLAKQVFSVIALLLAALYVARSLGG